MDDFKVTVKNIDMADTMRDAITELAVKAFKEYKFEKDIASAIKRDCDKQFGPTWQVIVGRNFGSFVTHEVGRFIYFYVGYMAVLLFKSG
ncbi:Dynein light chain 1, cytoplasmic [Coemansia sp. BCRC 34301]|nr:Dynein light chain 1, cytoplasmic [Coemansia sp. BCRC 34301]